MDQAVWQQAGEHRFFIPGPAGHLEVWVSLPERQHASLMPEVAVLMHPHPQYAGSMHNKVISTLAWAFLKRGVATVRFQFRGVGQSEGQYGHIEGEVADAQAILDWLQGFAPASITVAGFSFGAYIAAVMSGRSSCKQVLMLARSVERVPFGTLPVFSCPGVVIQGVADEVVSVEATDAWVLGQPLDYIRWQGVSHFFHGQLVRLRQLLLQVIQAGSFS